MPGHRYTQSEYALQQVVETFGNLLYSLHKHHLTHTYQVHQQKTFPSGRNGSVRVDALRQSRQRHPGGGLLRAQRQYHVSRCISPSDRRFAISSRSVGLLL